MFANQFAAAIAAAHPTQLDRCARDLWRAHGAELIADTDAQELAETIAARRAGLRRGPSPSVKAHTGRASIFSRRREQPARRHPERINRRRRLASSAPLPPALAAVWTTARLAILRIVGDEVREHGVCELSLQEIAARAGSCRTMARTTLRQAMGLGLVQIEERPRPGQKSLPNRVRIASAEWWTWLHRGPRNTLATMLAAFEQTGGKKTPPMDTSSHSIGIQAAKRCAQTSRFQGLGGRRGERRPVAPNG